MIKRECLICYEQLSDVPLLVCGHFICPDCYVKLKQCGKTTCPFCFKKLKRKIK